MSAIQKVSIALTAEQVANLKAAVERGEYATASEAVRDALRDWESKGERRRAEVERLRTLWNEGKASGTPAPLDIERVVARARAKHKAAG